jgi:4-aminobutyrate aminotransferase-like enzyme
MPAPASPSSAPAGQARTLGESLRGDEQIAGAIDTIVERVEAASAQITDVRPPREELRESYKQYLARAASTRGRPLLYPYIGSGLGNGALVELLDGSVKWDMICGIGVHFFGHSDPDLVRASLEASLDDTLKHGNLQSNFEAYAFAETLLAEARKHSKLNQCFVSTAGALANEHALKVCYQKNAPASRVIAFKDCFMGRTVTMAQIGDAAANRVGIPLTTLVDYMPFYDEMEAEQVGRTRYIDGAVKQLEEYIARYPNQHACFIFELIQGEGGFNTAPREFFTALMDVCKAANIGVWVDEIQTFGRTSTMFAYEQLNLGDYIDVLCVGKMTQACATLFTEEYAPKPGLLSGTFTGEGVSFRIGRRIIERLRDGDGYGPEGGGGGGGHARHFAAFCKHVRALADRHPDWFPKVEGVAGGVKDVCGGTAGMMRMTPFGGRKDAIWRLCQVLFDEGVIAFYCGHSPYHLRMLPPLGVMKESDWPRVFEIVERAMAKVAAEQKKKG